MRNKTHGWITLGLVALAAGCGGSSSSHRGSTTAAATTSSATPVTTTTTAPPSSRTPGAATLTESFSDTSKRDAGATDADWSGSFSGQLAPSVSGHGDGSDGALVVTQDTTLDADTGPFQFTRVQIDAGATLRATGSKPLVIYAQGSVVIDGAIDLSGADGGHGRTDLAQAAGGAGGPGAGAGGAGGTVQNQPGGAGEGPGGGQADGLVGAGAGHALAGGNGEGFVVNAQFAVKGSTGGAAYGTSAITSVTGGSGGSGGSPVFIGTVFSSGPAGGGGGGGLHIRARADVVLRGTIRADGGDGGGYERGAAANRAIFAGGGGSGGAVLIQAGRSLALQGGRISVRGGRGGAGANARGLGLAGGNGAPGRVRLEDADGQIDGVAGTCVPLPSGVVVGQAFTGGNATLGDFVAPAGVTTIDTSNGALHYRRFEVPASATILARGANPLQIYATEALIVDGTIDASGEPGDNAPSAFGGAPGLPGLGGPGGFRGGRGGESTSFGGASLPGEDGQGPGGGTAGPAPIDPNEPFGGAGGGYGAPGQAGNRDHTGGTAAGGVTYGDASLAQLQGGSGGAGAGGSNAKSGACGGGGGGAVLLQCAKAVVIRGTVRADGGHGGGRAANNAQPTLTSTPTEIANAAGGAGGSGGAILIQAAAVDLLRGRLFARGGFGGAGGIGGTTYEAQDGEAIWSNGGRGGDGRIRIEVAGGSAGGVDATGAAGYRSDHVEQPTSASVSTGRYAPPITGATAQSVWYAVGLDDPRFAPATVSGTGLSSALVQFQGADDDGSGQPDASTLTGWHDDATRLAGKEHVRFRVRFQGNASLDELVIRATN